MEKGKALNKFWKDAYEFACSYGTGFTSRMLSAMSIPFTTGVMMSESTRRTSFVTV
jgi:hypothetical protein